MGRESVGWKAVDGLVYFDFVCYRGSLEEDLFGLGSCWTTPIHLIYQGIIMDCESSHRDGLIH